MKSKTTVLVVVALVCGLGAAYMTSRLIAERNETATVLVAKQKLGPWTMIKDPAAMFEEKQMPKGEAPKTAVVRTEDLKDRILLRTLPAGQPVVAEDLQDKNKNSLETQITPGMRAIAIKTDAPSTVGGFVLPGSHVDVYYGDRIGNRSESRLVLQNILVRAVDLTNIRPEDKPGMVPTTVTLEVTPEQALVLVGLKDSGNLTLALRSVGDTVELHPPTPPKAKPTPAPKTQLAAATPKPVQVAKKPAPERHYLEIYNGSSRRPYVFTTREGVTTVELTERPLDVPASPTVATPNGAMPNGANPMASPELSNWIQNMQHLLQSGASQKAGNPTASPTSKPAGWPVNVMPLPGSAAFKQPA
ncbi:MAG TPA: Flp pilus assembly protein CpaB [Gemmataceae bacterium]|nr:Flp pilus assembly protein CpaB [Gemmataceae bacterium]